MFNFQSCGRTVFGDFNTKNEVALESLRRRLQTLGDFSGTLSDPAVAGKVSQATEPSTVAQQQPALFSGQEPPPSKPPSGAGQESRNPDSPGIPDQPVGQLEIANDQLASKCQPLLPGLHKAYFEVCQRWSSCSEVGRD